MAESAIQQAERRLDRARQARQRLGDVLAAKKGAVAALRTSWPSSTSKTASTRAKQSIVREKAALELAKSKQEILEKYTRDKTIRALKLDVESKRPERTGQTAPRGSSSTARRRSSKGKSPHARSWRPWDGMVRLCESPAPAMPTRRSIRSRKARRSANGRRYSACPDLTGPKLVTQGRGVECPQASGAACGPRFASTPSPASCSTARSWKSLPCRTHGLDPGRPRRLHDQSEDRQRRAGTPAGHVGSSRFPGRRSRKRALRARQGYPHYAGKDHVAMRKPGGAIELREVTLA